MKTAVEFLELHLLGLVSFDSEELRTKYKERINQAKEMFEEQIIEAWDKGDCCIDLPDGGWEQKYKSGEEYYNETFKSE